MLDGFLWLLIRVVVIEVACAAQPAYLQWLTVVIVVHLNLVITAPFA
jgi:hypothetical protein